MIISAWVSGVTYMIKKKGLLKIAEDKSKSVYRRFSKYWLGRQIACKFACWSCFTPAPEMSGRRFIPTKWEISLALATESGSHIVDVIFGVFSKNCLFPRQKWPNLKPAKKKKKIRIYFTWQNIGKKWSSLWENRIILTLKYNKQDLRKFQHKKSV